MRRQLDDPGEIGAAIERGDPVRVVLYRRGETRARITELVALARARGVAVQGVSERELLRAAAARREVELLACLGPDPRRRGEAMYAGGGVIWLLSGTAYPGNAGFVIRTAEVSGADAVVIDADFDRTDRRDAARAAMRADRYLPVEFESAEVAIVRARRAGRRVIAVEDSGDRAPWQVDLRGPVLLIVGSEARGIPAAVLDAADAVIRIPMAGFMPSYNLQAAMAVVVGERLRQSAGS